MPGFISDDQVKRVKDAVDLVQIMGDYTSLKKAGGNWAGCCPFHSERTPSMHVYDDGHYHCFGCGAHGDVFSLIRDKEHLDFTDAVELLARRAGIEVTYEKGGNQMPRGERDRLIEAVEMAARFYEHVLWDTAEGADARDYLASRGLSVEVCKRFRLGWAPGGGALVEEARRHRVDIDLLVRTDLAVDRNGRWVDRFYERVTFPICDRFGNPIAFSARLLPAAERAAKEAGRGVGKYVNSTDTPLYHKGNAVFNIHRARGPAREKSRLIVMEGPTDVMAADEAGYSECIAVLGTALTPEHAKQLGAIAGNGGRLVLVLDGDKAGQTSALKAIKTCLSVGVPCWVATVPDEMDPGELLKEDAAAQQAGTGGREAFDRVLDQARPDLAHLLRALAPRPYELENREVLAVADQILEILRPIQDRELIALCMRDCATWLNLDARRLEKRLAAAGAPAAGNAIPVAQALAGLEPVHEAIVHILVRCPDLRSLAFDTLQLEPAHFPAVVRPLVERLLLEPDVDGDALLLMSEAPDLAGLKGHLFNWVTSDLGSRMHGLNAASAEQGLRKAAAALKRVELVEQLRKIRVDIDEAQRRRDIPAAARLGLEQVALAQNLRVLKEAMDEQGGTDA
ncbi:MAG: DNA primase [Planctomycetes bacterium]|nr:DNA primase [Planctomycetota bacterium]